MTEIRTSVGVWGRVREFKPVGIGVERRGEDDRPVASCNLSPKDASVCGARIEVSGPLRCFAVIRVEGSGNSHRVLSTIERCWVDDERRHPLCGRRPQ